jgi:hypothetical protein
VKKIRRKRRRSTRVIRKEQARDKKKMPFSLCILASVKRERERERG